MRELKLYPKGTRYKYKNYNKKTNSIERPNLLNQMFYADKKNKIGVGDITYIPTRKGTLYLAVFLDIYSRKVVGWSMNKKMKRYFSSRCFYISLWQRTSRCWLNRSHRSRFTIYKWKFQILTR